MNTYYHKLAETLADGREGVEDDILFALHELERNAHLDGDREGLQMALDMLSQIDGADRDAP